MRNEIKLKRTGGMKGYPPVRIVFNGGSVLIDEDASGKNPWSSTVVLSDDQFRQLITEFNKRRGE